MKRVIVLLLSVILVLSFAGCSSGDSSESGSEQAAASDSGTLGDYDVSIKDYKLVKDYEGNDAIAITYDFTNNGEDAISFEGAVLCTVFQDGVELDIATVYLDEDEMTYLDDDSWKEIQTGKTIEVTTTHLLNDTANDVTVEVEEIISFDDSKLTKTFEIAQ